MTTWYQPSWQSVPAWSYLWLQPPQSQSGTISSAFVSFWFSSFTFTFVSSIATFTSPLFSLMCLSFTSLSSLALHFLPHHVCQYFQAPPQSLFRHFIWTIVLWFQIAQKSMFVWLDSQRLRTYVFKFYQPQGRQKRLSSSSYISQSEKKGMCLCVELSMLLLETRGYVTTYGQAQYFIQFLLLIWIIK